MKEIVKIHSLCQALISHFRSPLPVQTSGLNFRFRLPAEVKNQVIENDKVIYNKAIDKRSRKERAINIRLRTDKITEKREKGTGFESYKIQLFYLIFQVLSQLSRGRTALSKGTRVELIEKIKNLGFFFIHQRFWMPTRNLVDAESKWEMR